MLVFIWHDFCTFDRICIITHYIPFQSYINSIHYLYCVCHHVLRVQMKINGRFDWILPPRLTLVCLFFVVHTFICVIHPVHSCFVNRTASMYDLCSIKKMLTPNTPLSPHLSPPLKKKTNIRAYCNHIGPMNSYYTDYIIRVHVGDYLA